MRHGVLKRRSKRRPVKKVRFGKRTMKWGGAGGQDAAAAGGGGTVVVADAEEQRATITGYFETLRREAGELSASQVIARVCMFALVVGIPPSIVSEILTKLTWNSVPFSSIISERSVQVAMLFLHGATGLTEVVSGALSSFSGLATPYIAGIALRAATVARSFCPFSSRNLIGGLLLTYLATSNVEQDIATLQAGTTALIQTTIAGGRSVAEGTIARAAALGRAVNNSPGYVWSTLTPRMQAIALRASPILSNATALGDRAAPIFGLFGTGAALAADNLSGGVVALMRVTQSAGNLAQAAIARLPSLMDFLPEIPLGLPTLDGFDSDDESSLATAATAASVQSIQQLSQCIPLRGDPVIEGGENKVLKQNLQASSQVLEAAAEAGGAAAAGGGGGEVISPEAEEAILTATFVTTASASQPIVEQIQQSGSCAAGGEGSSDKRKREENSQVSALSDSGDERDTNRQRTGSYATQSLGTDTEDENADEAAVMEDEDDDEEGAMLRGMFGHKGGRRTRRKRRNVTKTKHGKKKTIKKHKVKHPIKRH